MKIPCRVTHMSLQPRSSRCKWHANLWISETIFSGIMRRITAVRIFPTLRQASSSKRCLVKQMPRSIWSCLAVIIFPQFIRHIRWSGDIWTCRSSLLSRLRIPKREHSTGFIRYTLQNSIRDREAGSKHQIFSLRRSMLF